jgi:hypothetical protein
MKRKLRRDLRLLQAWVVAATAGLVVLGVSWLGEAQTPRTRFTEIDVERINIVESDGTVRLVIANGARQADAVIDGRVIVPGNTRAAGMIFFNQQGDEVGGLIYSGRMGASGASASGSLTFDQWKQDQTVALQYAESNGRRRAGLEVVDRPTRPLTELADLMARRAAATNDDDRAAVQGEIEAFGQTKRRMYVGKSFENEATLTLADAEGRNRLALVVDAAGAARIRFLDESGNVVREIVP